MYKLSGEIEGVAPLLFNKPPSTETLDSGVSQKKTLKEKKDEAFTRLHIDDRGIFIPKWSFKTCLLRGATMAKLKEGRGSATPYIQATVFPEDDLLFGADKPDFVHEHWGRVPPKTGAAVTLRRPAFKEGWKLRFTLLILDDSRSAKQIRVAIDTAGLMVGLGAWRPEYGRFFVTDWSESR